MFDNLIRQATNCVMEMTCWPDWANPMSVLTFFNEFYGLPNAVTLAIFIGIIDAAIWAAKPKAATLAILGIYTTSIVSATWVNDVYIEPQFEVITYLIAVAIGSTVLAVVLKTLRE